MINYYNLPKFELTSRLSNLPNLDGHDVENHLLPEVNFKYYSTTEFHNVQSISWVTIGSLFSVLHCNVRSLSANHDSLMSLLSDLDFEFDVIGISETKIMQGKDPITNISMPDYSFISQPTLCNAGGVGFFIKDKIKFHARNDFTTTTNDFECLSIEIHLNNQCNIVCLVIYRHPHSCLENFSNYLTPIIEKISNERKYCVLMGDFNLNLLNCESHGGTDEFLNTMTSYFFQPHILQPTRITDHSATLIDNIYFNSVDHFTTSGNIIYDISDHLPNFLIISKLNFKIFKNGVFVRDYSHYNEEDLITETGDVNWETVYNSDDVNLAFNTFFNKLNMITEKHVPLKKLSKNKVKLLTKPWITKGLMISIKNKNKLYKLYLKSKNGYYLSKFKLVRNKLKHLLLISKRIIIIIIS